MRILFLVIALLVSTGVFGAVTPLPGVAEQSTLVGQPFPTPIGVRVTDDSGRPVAGIDVIFRSSSIRGGGLEPFESYFQLVVQTDFDGVARVGPAARADSGERHVITADTHPYYGTAVIYLNTTLVVSGPTRVTALSATDQTVVAGSVLPENPRVRVTLADGTPVRGSPVRFFPDATEVVGSFGVESSVTVMTDINGIAEAPAYTTSLAPGRGVVAAWHNGGNSSIAEARFFYTNTPPPRPANYQDMWWGGPSQSGWGVSVVQHDKRIFAVVFAYDEKGAPTWHVIPQALWAMGYGRILIGPTYQPRGTPYYAYDASRLAVGTSSSTTEIAFIGGNEARLFMTRAHFGDNTNLGMPGQPLFRQDFTVNPAIPLRGVGDMWWGGPSQNGWGIAIHEQPGALFSVWLTYGDDGSPTWFVMPGGTWTGANEYSGQIYRTHASAWLQAPYDGTQLQVIPVGNYRLRFAGGAATFDYTVDGRSGSLALTRQPF